jgi:hypothetical protein
MEAPKKGSSSWSTRGVVEGRSSNPSRVSFKDERVQYWHDQLVKSLRLAHTVETPSGSGVWKTHALSTVSPVTGKLKLQSLIPIPSGTHIRTYPEFHPDFVNAMYRELGRRTASLTHSSAIETARPRADVMLQEWRESDPRNLPAFKNAIRRFAAFAPEEAKKIATSGGKKTQRRRLSRKRTMRKKH